jgi:DNA repair photolyase
MRLQENPVNPFLKTSYTWLESPPAAPVTVHEEQAHSILTENDSPDIPYRWSLNPYRGCQHACAYCYARRTHEYLDLGAGTDFDTQIFVKINAPELLERELRRRTWKRETIAFSGVTDCYQPLESRYQLTRRCLEACKDVANPVGIVTKSYLVTRDADLLAELHRRSAVRVLFSVTFADESVGRRIEPGAPLAARRFEAMRQLHNAAVPVGVIVAPIIPGLNDRDIPVLLQQAAESGATWADYTPVRLPGSVAEVFLTRLRRELPAAAERVAARIRDLHGGLLNDPRFGCRMEGQGPYWESIQRLFETMATRHGLTGRGRCGHTDETQEPERPKQLTLF